jgi:hypothetical protein
MGIVYRDRKQALYVNMVYRHFKTTLYTNIVFVQVLEEQDSKRKREEECKRVKE